MRDRLPATGVHRNDRAFRRLPPVRTLPPATSGELTTLSLMEDTTVPKLEAPIVLVHGLCGFDRRYAFRRPVVDYFPGVRQRLEASGNRVYAPRVRATAGVVERAADLKRFLDHELPEPVHIVGHSMGGLDARY